MFNFYAIINMLYNKKKIAINPDTSLNLTLSKWLSYDKNNLACLKKILKYQFSISAKHYFYLLFFNIPKKFKAPFLKKITKEKPKENKLLDKIQYVLGWSKKDILKSREVLNLTILTDKKYWKKELGVK